MGKMGATSRRGKTKTDQILEYLTMRANEIITPSKIAKELGLNLQVATTIINRLAVEGIISKKARGQYIYKIGIDKKMAQGIYESIYAAMVESMGTGVREVARFESKGFDKEKPLESIHILIHDFKRLLGEKAVNSIVTLTIKSDFGEEMASSILRALGIE